MVPDVVGDAPDQELDRPTLPPPPQPQTPLRPGSPGPPQRRPPLDQPSRPHLHHQRPPTLRSVWIQEHHRDGAISPGLVLGVALVGLDDPRPPRLTLFRGGNPRCHSLATSVDLNPSLGASDEIEIPVRIDRSASIGGDHHQAPTVAKVEQRHLVRPPRSPTGSGQDEHVVVDQAPPDESTGQAIDSTMPSREPPNPRDLHLASRCARPS